MKIEQKFVGTITLKFSNMEDMSDMHAMLEHVKNDGLRIKCCSKIRLIKSVIDVVRSNEGLGRQTSLKDIKTAIDPYVL